MYVHHVVGTGRYTTSTTNMYDKDRFHVPAFLWAHPWTHFQPALLPPVRRYTFTQSCVGVAVALLRRGMARAVPGTFLMFAPRKRLNFISQ